MTIEQFITGCMVLSCVSAVFIALTERAWRKREEAHHDRTIFKVGQLENKLALAMSDWEGTIAIIPLQGGLVRLSFLDAKGNVLRNFDTPVAAAEALANDIRAAAVRAKNGEFLARLFTGKPLSS